MANGMTIAQMYQKVYTGTPTRVLKLRTKKELTGRKLGFHPLPARPDLRGEWLTKLEALPNRSLFEVTESMKPRPVFLTPGRNGRACLLIGHANWSNLTTGIVRPGDLLEFRKWFIRGGVQQAEQNMFPGRTAVTPRLDELKWRFGDDVKVVNEKAVGWNGFSSLTKDAMLQQWTSLELCQGARVLAITSQGGGPKNIAVMIRAVGNTEMGFRTIGQESYTGSKVVNWEDVSLVGLSGTALTSVLSNVAIPVVLQGGWLASETFVNRADPPDCSIRLRVNPEPAADVIQPYRDRMVATCGDLAAALGFTDSFALGTYYPMPMVSQQVGWITGFGNDHGPVMIEVAELGVAGNNIDIVTEWASLDIRREDFLRLFPSTTLPADKKATVDASFSTLPANIWFRSILLGKGLKYPESTDYTTTVLAKDVTRVGSTLDELLFDSLEDNGPAVSYESLGARSLVAISKGKNAFVALVLASDDATFVSQLQITFSKSGAEIVATQNGYPLDSGQAFVALKTGAPYTFSGVTQDEVAISFFKMVSWAALTAALAEASVARAYIVDENQNSNDGRFNLSDDETARAIPLLLGFSRHEFSVITGSLILGVTKPEL